MNAPAPSFNFLFRTDEGRIDRAVWRRGTIALAGLFVLLTLGWVALAPWAHRSLGGRALIDWRSIVAYGYLLFYAFAIILIAVCFYNLSAKRWRDRGRPAALAGTFPLGSLLAAAAHWLVPRSEGVLPIWIPLALDGITLAIALWTAIELGCLPGRLEKST